MPIRFLLLLAALSLSQPVFAETAMLRIDSLPLDEAAAAAQSQLSDHGHIATLPSRKMLIIDDDALHIDRIRTLLKQLDTPPAQLTMRVAISEHAEISRKQLSDAVILPGGWVRIDADSSMRYDTRNNRYTLRVSSGSAGHIRAGEIRVVGQRANNYLSAHGIGSAGSMQTLDVTGGFDVQATLLADDMVRLAIHPWLRNAATNGEPERAGNKHGDNKPARIMLTEAATELTVKLGEKVTLAASRSAAGEFSYALLGVSSMSNHREVTISLTVTRASM